MALLLPVDTGRGISHEGANNSRQSSTQVGARHTNTNKVDAALKVPWHFDQGPYPNGNRAHHEEYNNGKRPSTQGGACLPNTTKEDAATKVPCCIGVDDEYNSASLPDIKWDVLTEVARNHTTYIQANPNCRKGFHTIYPYRSKRARSMVFGIQITENLPSLEGLWRMAQHSALFALCS